VGILIVTNTAHQAAVKGGIRRTAAMCSIFGKRSDIEDRKARSSARNPFAPQRRARGGAYPAGSLED
jgi:hypothetical protein